MPRSRLGRPTSKIQDFRADLPFQDLETGLRFIPRILMQSCGLVVEVRGPTTKSSHRRAGVHKLRDATQANIERACLTPGRTRPNSHADLRVRAQRRSSFWGQGQLVQFLGPRSGCLNQ